MPRRRLTRKESEAMGRLITVIGLGTVIAALGIFSNQICLAVLGVVALQVGEAMWLSKRVVKLEGEVAALCAEKASQPAPEAAPVSP